MDNNIEIVSPLIDSSLCRICLESKPGSKPCSAHGFCDSCIETYLKERIRDGSVLSISCPCSQCFYIFTPEEILHTLNEDWHFKYLDILNKKKLESNIFFRWCPGQNCSGYDLFEGSNQLTCKVCSKQFCFLCSESWHPGQKCKGFLGKEFKQWAKKQKLKLCPQCRLPVQKNGGCPNITCTKCNYRWCWHCLQCCENHDEGKCFRESQDFDHYWIIVLLAMFLPISVLFAYFIIVIAVVIIVDDGMAANDIVKSIKIHKALHLLSSFILSPFIMILSLSLAPFILIIVAPLSFAFSNGFSFIKYIFWQLLFFMIYPLISTLFYAVLGIVLLVVPIVGFFVFLYKLFHLFRNRKHRKLFTNDILIDSN